MEDLIAKGKRIINSQQNSVLSATSLIMVMIVVSMVLGLIRQRVLASYFTPDSLSLFFAAFRLPDAIFQVLVFGTFSSAFIPVFTKTLKEGEAKAWLLAGKVVSIGLAILLFAVAIVGFGAVKIYSVIAPGYGVAGTAEIAFLARILFAAQGFFVISYVLTGVLESLRRFLIPALAPIFYNLGIILGTVILTPYLGLTAPAVGVVIGAFAHFIIQYPLSRKLGFRFTFDLRPDDGVKKIGQLALPRVIDLAFDQIGKSAELFLSSIISQASYTYYTFANSLQLLPVTLFGTSLAKAVLPMLSSVEGDWKEYRKILLAAIYQAIFFTLPLSAALIALRIPVVRLIYGTKIFDWEATIQTGTILSVFAIATVSQTLMSVLARAFFALHDTKTPVLISFIGLAILVVGDFILVKGFHLEVWALAASFAVSTIVEAIILLILIDKKVGGIISSKLIIHVLKILGATTISGGAMFFILKIFDKSVWVKRLSFLSGLEVTKTFPFERFMLDTRYTGNVIILTVMTFLVGALIYTLVSLLFKIEEARYFIRVVRRIMVKRTLPPLPPKEQEPITPVTDTQVQ
ncbi:murein biosynthesis integral membrane protein MurJ [Candidatus Woesebacteria bacterium RIFOXYB1_FULL_42_36]|uniref:Probable lipid II flippase MurJ n=3 Tax=Candidatus Woeseibacteriota TaxID=1752722 RepID=A0A1F8DJ58_9BACT|nr:MAG: murein biosynthesis integral membrane protein MurJ [Candidatus Woesebacteria bacterium RIFOXYA1_FULL_43_16]OGM83307.1 MAG: murein biosynthesis integral membrane protein MurJ [Candidatus Woesebacteria bacterium RIFOXYB1_FULL_42_36]OGM84213.1 MAG: murein biosynthesis integral membrane protein MurJ [Candidatus Woesebacteria bacterium RIFOXYC1_FULL_43_18]OGM88640.1 MAG: murein biosynthesis integral membrane protein MurJ [Candidatus Woesebacteria bacterium RIFOXYD1_FULL_43_18]